MFIYTLRRILYTVPIAIGVSIVCFALIHISPGDPLSAVLPEGASPEMIAQVRQAYGFDQPLIVQYLRWLALVVQGDFGISIVNRRPVLDEVMTAAANTLILGGAAVLLGFAVGTAMGILAGYTAGTGKDKVVTAAAISGVSIPHYWLGIVLVIVFAVNLNLLPATGMGGSGTDGFRLDWEGIRHMILPAVTLAVIPGSIIARSVRGTVADVRKQEFVQTLTAKGLPPGRIFVHIMRNALPSVLAIMGLQLAQLLGGSILVETVFAWPGTGFLLNNAIFSRDLPVLQGTILTLAMIFVAVNLIIDIVQAMFDPRIKRA
ncbi:ABC transporter permease [Xanthobacter sp. KR7-65]|uniref:ABC transporter permease n=1 Tax=Xanthobacter sp. KR7-65 TaxID=3156612 RepID=UPI0032B3DCBA